MRFFTDPKFGYIEAAAEGEESELVAAFFVSEVQGSAENCDRLIERLERVKNGVVADADFSGDIHECSIEPDGVRIARWEDGATCGVPLDTMLRYASDFLRLVETRAKK